MSATPNTRTNRELLKALHPPVARFYPFDFHTHSIGSHDVCVGNRFLALPDALRNVISNSTTPSSQNAIGELITTQISHDLKAQLPYAKEPSDHKEHDRAVTTPDFLAAFYQSLQSRRDTLVADENISPTDNWSVIGITDHNTAEFSTSLASHAWTLRASDRLIVLPGIELEVQFPIAGTSSSCPLHILCLYAPCTTASDIRLAINEAKPGSTATWDFGSPIAVDLLPPFIQKLRNHQRYPAICVAAHVWSNKGIANEPKKIILESLDANIARLQGELERAQAEQDAADTKEIESRLQQVLAARGDSDEMQLMILRLMGQCGFDGLQVRDQSHERHYKRLHRFRDHHGRAIPIVCSDAHSPSGVFLSGEHVPYIKLNVGILSSGGPTAVFSEIQRKALRFGETRTTYSTPGRVSYWIEGIEIVTDADDARQFWEVSEQSTPGSATAFVLPLSRNLNCFVGGRGSGKSSLIEAIAFLTDQGKFKEEGQKRGSNRDDWYRRAEATFRGCRLRLVWKTTATTGIGALPKRALFASRYFDIDGRHADTEFRDADGNAIVDSTISAPKIQLLRAHEIERTAHSDNLRILFDDLCGTEIASLSQTIERIRNELKAQRTTILNVCRQLVELTTDGGALRQYGIRKKQFEMVDKPELRERFEQVDRAEMISKAATSIRENWSEINASARLQQLENELVSFFDSAATSIIDEAGQILEGHDAIYASVRHALDPAEPGPRENVIQPVHDTKEAMERGGDTFLKLEAAGIQDLQDRRNHLAKDGLPTGSSEREAKKRAFDEAKSAFQKYQALITNLNELLSDRKGLFEQLVEACRKRTELRKSHSENLTRQLQRDLDADVLCIQVRVSPLAEKSEFIAWLEAHLDHSIQRFRPQRRAALLECGLMPPVLRDILLSDGEPDVTPLTNQRERAEDGRISVEDCARILEKCRGRRLLPLDEADQWDAEFLSGLPEDIQKGVITFPPAESTLCIDHVLSLDEVVLDDVPEILLNDRPFDQRSVARPLRELSPGQRCSAILPLLLLSGDYPLVIDQPEENLDNRLIRQVIVNILASMKLRRQVIIATHNPNLPVLGDAEQCVVLQASGRDLSKLVAVGSLDSPQVARYITDIMEGGREAFQYRQSIYQAHWEDVVDEHQPAN